MFSQSRIIILTVGLLFLSISTVFATHNRAGEISVEQIDPLTVKATITTYTKASSIQTDRDSLTLCWGDGTCDVVVRLNGIDTDGDGVPDGERLPNDTKVNIYMMFHVYPGIGTFRLFMTDPNRNGQILNVNPPNSDMVEFHIQTTYTLLNPQFEGTNNTPRLLQPPIDIGCVGQPFIHNPNAFDEDGDSLGYELIVPLRGIDEETGQAIEVPNYLFPNEINPGPNNNHRIDQRTGEFIWIAPQRPGEYNIAFNIIEYRQGIPIDTTIRDMQILIEDCENQPPEIEVIREICVIAGETLELDVVVTDPDRPEQLVDLTALGGPFEVEISPARLEVAPGFQAQPLTGRFIWETTCEHISDQEYQVVFRATDNQEIVDNRGEISFLSALETVLIKVVGPPPENVEAIAQPEQIRVSWESPYSCEDAADNFFQGFSVWRRIGSNQFPPDTCRPGLGGQGYTRLNVVLVTDMEDGQYVFFDEDVERGRTYCYRILANFAQLSAAGNPFNRVESLPSEEACVQLSRDIPLITRVSVINTDPNSGSIEVNWTRPVAEDLDTILNPGPYRYQLWRAEGLNGTDFQPVAGANFESQFFSNANDTIFIDEGLNTVNNAYSYRVAFHVNGENEPLGETNVAASVFLNAAPTDEAVNLSWQEMVPWDNFEYIIFRQNEQGGFDSIGITTDLNFTDTGLINGEEFCYRVESVGTYGIEGIVSPLLNFSQEVCSVPGDNVPPCPPTLEVSNICDNLSDNISPDVFVNTLMWTNPNEVCEGVNDVEQYNIYFTPTEDGEFELIETITFAGTTTYDHQPDIGIAGCYVVTAVDSNRNESIFSNVVCVDNCPSYTLPNTFTPNGDGTNELFRPFPYRFIDRVDFKVYNRWGGLVFETTDPSINWDGTNLAGNDLNEGVYYYVCRVFESRVNGVVEQEAILNGSIHLIRGR